MIIAICGIDGSGKTSHINKLCEELEERGHKIYKTKQPTNFYREYDRFRKYVNKDISDKNIVYELALLSAADKIRHYETEIKYAEERNEIVISDRYVFSAYSYFISRGINDIEWLKSINKYLPMPDLTIYLDIDPKVAIERVIERDGKYTKKEETDFEIMNKVRECFLNQPWGKLKNYYILSTSNSFDEVHAKIMELFDRWNQYENN